jgi:hypothetical protein
VTSAGLLTVSRRYATTWLSTTGHVSTKTEISYTTITRTSTRPGSTKYATTVTLPQTYTTVEIAFPTVTSTVWEKGCQSWACQL